MSSLLYRQMLGGGLDQIKSIDASQPTLFCSFSELKKVTGMFSILPEWLRVVPRRQHQDEAIAFRLRGSAVWCTLWDVRKPQEFSRLPEGFDHIFCLRLVSKALGSCKAAVYFLYLKKQKTCYTLHAITNSCSSVKGKERPHMLLLRAVSWQVNVN